MQDEPATYNAAAVENAVLEEQQMLERARQELQHLKETEAAIEASKSGHNLLQN